MNTLLLFCQAGEEKNKKNMVMAFQYSLHYDNGKLEHKERNILMTPINISTIALFVKHKNNITYLHLVNNYLLNYSLMAT